ncbi:MAG TPA: glycoside hydrolase family 3 N-terminal domain-containing protein [Gaiellaceae bacterium]
MWSCSTTISTSPACSSAARCMSRCRWALLAALVATGCVQSAGATAPGFSKLVGQTIMTGFSGTQPSAELLARVRAGEVGGIILFGSNIANDRSARSLVARLQSEAAAGGNPPLLIATDQEGGEVRRFPDGPPDEAEADVTSVGQARANGTATGAFLRHVGVNVDLAPVLDSPSSPANFLGSRAYGADPSRNAAFGRAFVTALQAQRVAATAKHFPGLGTAPANTDDGHVWITTPKSQLDVRLAPFAAAVRAGVDLVMVSNAGYRGYDPSGLPAVLSRRIVNGLLRKRLGFRGVVISDTMGAPGPSGHADAALVAVEAGTDVLLELSDEQSTTAFRQLFAAAKSGKLPLADLRAADARIAKLKSSLR